MKYLRMVFGLIAVAATVLPALGAGTASATTLEIGGVAQNKSVSYVASLEAGFRLRITDSAGTTTDECSSLELKGKTTTFTSTPSGPVETLTFGSCTHTTTVLANGSLSVTNIAGTTNGTVTSSGAEVTVVSTAFGVSAVCKTGAGTVIGKITGLFSGHPTLDLTGKIGCGILGTAHWEAFLGFTSPTGLGVTS